MVTKTEISLAAMERLLLKAGAQRVGEDAKEALRGALEEYAIVLGKRAAEYAKHADRKTVRGDDVSLAKKHA